MESRNEVSGVVVGGLVQAGTIGVVAMPANAPQALAGLPADDGLVGREQDLAVLDDTLAVGTASPVLAVVAGLAGVGKTALVVRAAGCAVYQRGWFPGGVLFVDLHGYDPDRRVDPMAALGTLLRALGVAGDHVPPDQQGRELLYRSLLSQFVRQARRVLVIADNAATVDQVLPLRPGDPAHRMLVTSRDTLPLPGARRIELDVLPRPDAIGVLDHAVRMTRPADGRVDADPAAAGELARLCGYLPLALRIIAQVLADQPERGVASVVQDLAHTRDRLSELAYGDVMAVRAVFDASYQRLPCEQARLFRLLSLVPGPHSDLGAAAALADEPVTTTRRLLEGLRRAHLIQSARWPGSYHLHDLLHLYARERCAQDEVVDDRAALERLLAYYRDTARAAHGHLDPRVPAGARSDRFDGYRSALTWLDSQWPNLVAAVPRAFATGNYGLARDIPAALFFAVDLRGHWADWATMNEVAYQACDALEDQRGAAFARNNLGDAYREQGAFDQAVEHYQAALQLCRGLDARRDEGVILGNLGNTYYALRRFAEALHYHEQALTICRNTGDRYSEGTALNNLGNALRNLGRFDQAIDRYHEDLAICREIGARRGEGIVLGNLGSTYYQMRRFDTALEYFQDKLEICRETDDQRGEAAALNNLGSTHRELGHSDLAAEHYKQALARHTESGCPGGDGEILINLATLSHELGRHDDARNYAEQAMRAFQTP